MVTGSVAELPVAGTDASLLQSRRLYSTVTLLARLRG